MKLGYSAMSEAVSYLEVGSYGWVQVVNFAVFGALLIALAGGFTRALHPLVGNRVRAVSGAFLVLSGLGYLTAAVFPPAAFGQPQTDLIPTLHTVAFEMVFFGPDLACVTAGGGLVKTAGWRVYRWYSLVTGILLLIPPIGNLSSFLTSTQQAVFFNPQHFQLGCLFNRIVLVVAFAWYVVTVVRLLRSW